MKAALNRRCLLAVLGVALSLPAYAHEGAEEEIEELTEVIQIQGYSTDLLIRRALEYQILGQFAEAARDLERALEIDRDSANAQRELGRTYFALGKTTEALAAVSRALQGPGDGPDRASLFMTHAGILRARRDYAKALEDANQAIALYPLNVEWYLIRSQLQRLLKRKDERVKGLDEGMRATGSGLLAEEWVDASIDAGQATAALPVIEEKLATCRWKSAWLIRRAKANLALGKAPQAREDLNAAVEELNRRVGTAPPEALLLAERATAYDLLEKRAEARRDYRAARDHGLVDEWVRERIRALRESPKDEEE